MVHLPFMTSSADSPTGFSYPPEALAHLDHDEVAWLTTVTDSGAPSPTPIWFLRVGNDIVSFSEPTFRKVHNLRARPAATLHFNSDHAGQDIVVIHATVRLEEGAGPSSVPGYVEKYAEGLATWGMSVEDYDATSSVKLIITPRRIWLGPES